MKIEQVTVKPWHREAAKSILKNVKQFYAEYRTFDGITEDVALEIAEIEAKAKEA